MPIKILINVYALRIPLTGIGYYTLNIVQELLDNDIELVAIKNGMLLDREAIIKLLSSLSTINETNKNNSKFKMIVIKCIQKIPNIYLFKKKLSEFISKGFLKQLSEANYVYIEPNFIPLKYNGHAITIIHDLSFVTHPEFHPKGRVNYLMREINTGIKNSTHVMVDSYFILEQLHKTYPLSMGKSSAVHLGVDSKFKKYESTECKGVLERFNLNYKSFILSVATLEPRKNLTRLVEAYSRLPEDIRVRTPLVLAGGYGWKNDELFDTAELLINLNQIIFTGYLSDDELTHLYSSANVFAYPSLYEGFGLPVIEAMASGTPVLTSNISATAEIAGNAAVLIEPYSVNDIYINLEKLLIDPKLREDHAARGLEQVKKFKWKYTTAKILEIANSISKR